MHNGTRLNLDRSRYRASLSVEPEVLQITLEIFDFTDDDAGFYMGVVNTEPSTLFSYFDCDSVDRVQHTQIPIGLVPISLQKIGLLKKIIVIVYIQSMDMHIS